MFTEPDLLFEVVERTETEVHLRVFFRRDFRPPWAPMDDEDPWANDVWVELAVAPAALARAAADLREQLRRFPPRS